MQFFTDNRKYITSSTCMFSPICYNSGNVKERKAHVNPVTGLSKDLLFDPHPSLHIKVSQRYILN